MASPVSTSLISDAGSSSFDAGGGFFIMDNFVFEDLLSQLRFLVLSSSG